MFLPFKVSGHCAFDGVYPDCTSISMAGLAARLEEPVHPPRPPAQIVAVDRHGVTCWDSRW